jgi:hypothetical protein
MGSGMVSFLEEMRVLSHERADKNRTISGEIDRIKDEIRVAAEGGWWSRETSINKRYMGRHVIEAVIKYFREEGFEVTEKRWSLWENHRNITIKW